MDEIPLNELYSLDERINDLSDTTDILKAIEQYEDLKETLVMYEQRGYDMFDYKVEMTKAYYNSIDHNVR